MGKGPASFIWVKGCHTGENACFMFKNTPEIIDKVVGTVEMKLVFLTRYNLRQVGAHEEGHPSP